jgi:hypothetical protein
MLGNSELAIPLIFVCTDFLGCNRYSDAGRFAMRKTLANAAGSEEIARRVAALTPGSPRQWGTMSVGGMMCHLDDSYQVALSGRIAARVREPLPRWMIKYLALRTSLPWVKNMKTLPEVQQGAGGTCPGSFAQDQGRLLDTLMRFSACPTLAHAQHPFFGAMSKEDWLRWGYLHADHHLRQFSA